MPCLSCTEPVTRNPRKQKSKLYGHRNFQDKMRRVEGFDKMIYTPTPLVPKRGWLVILFFSCGCLTARFGFDMRLGDEV